MNDKCGMVDDVVAQLGYGRGPNDRCGIRGHVIAELFGPDGKLKQREETHNLVTDIGDIYFAKRAYSTESLATFYMKTASDNVIAAKSGSGSYIVSNYNEHSVAAMVTNWPAAGATNNVAQFKSTWAADADHAYTVRRVALTINSDNNADEAAADCYAMSVFSADIVKTAADTLTITWNITFTGA